jgi:hypothetical protein
MAKALISVKPFVRGPKEKKLKYCATCANLATVEALFNVGDGVTMIEKYCDACSKKIKSRS